MEKLTKNILIDLIKEQIETHKQSINEAPMDPALRKAYDEQSDLISKINRRKRLRARLAQKESEGFQFGQKDILSPFDSLTSLQYGMSDNEEQIYNNAKVDIDRFEARLTNVQADIARLGGTPGGSGVPGRSGAPGGALPPAPAASSKKRSGRGGGRRRGRARFMPGFDNFAKEFVDVYGGVGPDAFDQFYAVLGEKGIPIKRDYVFGPSHAKAFLALLDRGAADKKAGKSGIPDMPKIDLGFKSAFGDISTDEEDEFEDDEEEGLGAPELKLRPMSDFTPNI